MRKVAFLFLLFLRPIIRPLLFLASLIFGFGTVLMSCLLYLDPKITYLLLAFLLHGVISFFLWWQYDEVLFKLAPDDRELILM